jgi:hypothetical protein
VRRFSFLLSLLVVLSLQGVTAIAKVQWEMRAAFFATYGSYSNRIFSDDYAGYLTLARASKYYITVAYDDVLLSAQDWSYWQRMGVGGVLLRPKPYSLRAYYGHVQGDYRPEEFSMRRFPDLNRDLTDFYSGEFSYLFKPYETGLSFTYLKSKEYLQQTSRQVTGRFEWSPSNKFTLKARPNFVSLTDDRQLWSLTANVSYYVLPKLIIKTGGAVGERAYYFDNDLLTIYNQNETQTGLAFLQLDFMASKNLLLTEEYIWTEFQGFSIHYLVLGAKYTL